MIDIVIYIAIGIAAIVGYRYGVIRQIGSLSALLLAVVACYIFGDAATDFVASFMEAESANALNPEEYWTATMIGHITLFVAVWICIGLASNVISKVAKATCLEPVDGVFGAVFMTLKILIAISVILNIWGFIQPETDFINSSSPVVKFTYELWPKLMGIVHENL